MDRLRDQLPAVRPRSEFIVETLADEVLVYDQTSHRAHCLSPAAAMVWRMCDGQTTATAAQLALSNAGFCDDVNTVLGQLQATGLVKVPAARRRTVDKSRRAFFSSGAVAAGIVLASPVIFSIVAPSVAEAASACGAKTQVCCTGNKCNPTLKCVSGHCQ